MKAAGRIALCAALAILATEPAVAAPRDDTAIALDRCLAAPEHAATAGQTDCEAIAAKAYDRRLNTAYAALLRRLPPDAAERLHQSQRAWLSYRDSETPTRQAIYATLHGTMYVRMEADAAVTLVADRARLLERYLRTLDIAQ